MSDLEMPGRPQRASKGAVQILCPNHAGSTAGAAAVIVVNVPMAFENNTARLKPGWRIVKQGEAGKVFCAYGFAGGAKVFEIF